MTEVVVPYFTQKVSVGVHILESRKLHPTQTTPSADGGGGDESSALPQRSVMSIRALEKESKMPVYPGAEVGVGLFDEYIEMVCGSRVDIACGLELIT